MKYTELLQVADYFRQYKKINFIKRLENNILKLSLNSICFIFDLSKDRSGIYTAQLLGKNFNAPFDIMLKKYFCNAEISNVEVLKDNRILVFETFLNKAYKSLKNKIFFEFTGKNTNVIITDENNIILEALRHIEKSYRSVKVGLKLEELKPFKIDEQSEKIQDFKSYFEDVFKEVNEKKLENLRSTKLSQLDKKMKNLKNLKKSLPSEDSLLKDSEKYAIKADILFANLSRLKDFERKFVLKDFEGNDVEFDLENSPKQSANDLYKLSKKLKQKSNNINLQKSNIDEKILFYERLLHLVKKSRTLFELEVLLPKKERREKKDEINLGVANFYFNEFKVCVGKNEAANEYLLKNAKKDDIWFHVKDLPSSHTFITSNKLKPSEEVLKFAAKLCVNFSNLSRGIYLVDYTSKKFVKIKQKAFVEYTNYKTLSISKE